MAVSPHLVIVTLVRGSQRLNQEKSEINWVLNFLKPYFEKLAHREISRKREKASTETVQLSVLNVFSVTDDVGNSIRYDAAQHWGKEGYTLTYVDACIPKLDHELLRSDSNPVAETLAVEDVGACHKLLIPLLGKMVELFPEDIPPRLKTFYQAAERY